MTSGGGSSGFGEVPEMSEPETRDTRSGMQQAADALRNIATRAAPPRGTICMYAGKGSPEGWAWCKGDELSRTEEAEMFELLGTTFGEGDGSTTFNLPYLPDPLPGIHYIIKMAGRRAADEEPPE